MTTRENSKEHYKINIAKDTKLLVCVHCTLYMIKSFCTRKSSAIIQPRKIKYLIIKYCLVLTNTLIGKQKAEIRPLQGAFTAKIEETQN